MMLKIENTEVIGWKAAIRGMRNTKKSLEKSDSGICPNGTEFGYCYLDHRKYCQRRNTDDPAFCIGPKDLDLMTRLRNTCTDHCNFMQMIAVYLDITAPLYWWKEADQYKVGTVTNSCSTMYKIEAKEFELSDFSIEHLVCVSDFKYIVDILNCWRSRYTQCDDDPTILQRLDMTKKEIWWQLIQLLPSSYNQKRTIMLNYEVLANIYKSRRNYKLDEWHTFCDWIEGLPYSELITGKEKRDV